MDRLLKEPISEIATGDDYQEKVVRWFAVKKKLEKLRKEALKLKEVEKEMKKDSRLMTLVGNIERLQAKEDLEEFEESEEDAPRGEELPGRKEEETKLEETSTTRIQIPRKVGEPPKKKQRSARKRLHAVMAKAEVARKEVEKRDNARKKGD